MKSLKLVLASVFLSLCAVVAHAQDLSAQVAPTANNTTVAQNLHRSSLPHQREVRGSKKADDCVGPVSFCNIYFGS
jgi:hypothetical protein